MAQQVEHVLGKDEVTGSNPVSSSNNLSTCECLFAGAFILFDISISLSKRFAKQMFSKKGGTR